MQGYIKLHREIRGHWLWEEEIPFDNRSAWIDLLLQAQYKDVSLMLDGEKTEIYAGEVLTNLTYLAERWMWNRKKVVAFLDLLEKDEMISRATTKKRTLIKIHNWGKYQDPGTTLGTTLSLENTGRTGIRGTTLGTTSGQRWDTTKESKEIDINNIYIATPRVRQTEEDVDRWVAKLGNRPFGLKIQKVVEDDTGTENSGLS